jgi:hypothetical protein
MDPIDILKGTPKAYLGKIPLLGPVLTGLLEAKAREVQEARLLQFLEDLRTEFEAVPEEEFDREYLHSQDYAHLILLAAENSQRTRQHEKQRLYARALVMAGTKAWADRCDLAEELLNILADLSPIEFQVLRAAWDHCALAAPPGGPLPIASATLTAASIAPRLSSLGLGEADVGAYLGKLQRLGLTQVASINLSGLSGSMFRLTPLFERLMELIRAATP